MTKTFLFFAIAAILIIPDQSLALDDEIQEGPYIFRPGVKLYYSCTEKLDYAEGTVGSNEQLIIWTIIINPDLTYRLILEHHSRNFRIDAEGNRSDYPEQITWSYCDVNEKGQFKKNYHFDLLAFENLNPANLFIELPEDEDIARAGWMTSDIMYGISGNVYHYQWNPDRSSISDVVIELKIETPLDPIYLLETKGELHYDPEYCLPVLKIAEQSRDYGRYAGKSLLETKLDSVSNFNPEEFLDFENSLYSYLEAESTYQAVLEGAEAEKDQAGINAVFARAKGILDQTAARITDTIIKKQFDRLVDGFNDDTLDAKMRFERFSGFIGQPAKEWKTKDFNDKTHKLKRYKGKIILLDFWYRGCPWCMHSIPQLMQVYTKYKDKPFVLLGMNVDKEEIDARFVIDKMQLKYTNLFARDIAKDYDVKGYPTFFIIDQDGIIRDMHVGWSPDLADQISETVDELLTKQK